MSHKDFENFYDNIYDGVSDDDMDLCPDCNSYVFPEEIINIKENTVVGHNNKFDLYINDNYKIIPSNRMKLIGITLEGTNENNDKEAVELDLNEENFKKLYYRGKDLWDKGYVSKYIILFLQDNKCFGFHRPDMINFERYHNLSYYLDYDNDIFSKEHHTIGKSKTELLKRFDIEKTINNFPHFERGEELEM